MKIRRRLAATIGMTAMIGAASALAAAGPAPAPAPGPAPAKAKIGQPAPNFALKDVKGTVHKLSEQKGKIVVLQWINPECPVCRRCTEKGVVERMRKEMLAIDKDIVHFAINSSHHQNPKISAAYLEKNKLSIAGLDDADGTVGKIYGARKTPHMYVIDKEGVLRYEGAIDNDGRGTLGKEATNYVVNAVRQIAAGETVAPDHVDAYGCSVKYKKSGAGQGRRGKGRGTSGG